MNAPFSGEYRHVMDGKGRISVPAKFRPFLGEKFYVARVFESCLFVYPMEEWVLFMNSLSQISASSAKMRAFERKVFSGAVECTLDKAGRFLIPQTLREYAKLDSEVVLVGVRRRMEVWDVKEWESYLNNMEEAHNGFSEEFAQLQI